jgi:FixJ family two-component response regulator
LDIQLPDINGLFLQETMERRGISIPIVFITGHGDIPMSVKGMKAGAIDFLPKPFTKRFFRLVAKGMLSKQIAQKWGTALVTIKVSRSRVMQKMQAKTVTELIHFAQKAGITSLQG